MFSKKTQRTLSGFTIIEVMVTVAIIAILSAILMYQFKNFDSRLLLKNLAYEIAITLREAQVYGVSVRGGTGGFEDAYGVHFDLSKDKEYILFRDSNTSGVRGVYDLGEMVSTYTIGRGNRISSICTPICNIDPTNLTRVDITFKRPSSEAVFFVNGFPSNATDILINVSSVSSPTFTQQITVSNTGRIRLRSY